MGSDVGGVTVAVGRSAGVDDVHVVHVGVIQLLSGHSRCSPGVGPAIVYRERAGTAAIGIATHRIVIRE